MARAYSLDLLERVVAAVAAGQSCRSVARTFMVSVASVVKWSQRQRALGGPAALKMGGHRPYLVARERDWVLARIAEKPDLTLRALLKELADRGLAVTCLRKSVWRIRTGTAGTGHEDALRLNAGVGFESGPLLPMIDARGF
jgi:transposase